MLSLGYCFSASLPPLLTAAAMASLEQIERKPALIKTLQEKSAFVHEALMKLSDVGFTVSGYVQGPVKHLRLLTPPQDKEKHTSVLHEISQFVRLVLNIYFFK